MTAPKTLREAITIQEIPPKEGTPDIRIRAGLVAVFEQSIDPRLIWEAGIREQIRQSCVARLLNCAYGEFRDDLRELRYLIRDLAGSDESAKMQHFQKANEILSRIDRMMFDPAPLPAQGGG